MELRSYRRVFDFERRIYRIDGLRLNPGGVPVRGLVYFLLAAAAASSVVTLPLLGAVAATVPWYARDLLVPGAIAALAASLRPDGRPFHHAALSLARLCVVPHQLMLTGARPPSRRSWQPPEIVVLPDGSDARMRALRYAGPGAVVVAVEHECRHGAGTRWARPLRPRPAAAGLVLIEAPGARALTSRRAIVVGRGARVRVTGRSPRSRAD